MEQKINTANPDAIIYNTEEIRYTILGGIRLEGLDRLRVTIKIEVINRKFVHYLNNPELAALAIRQNLDLYNNTQTEKLARLIAERLETGVTQVTKDLSDITSQLENYRLQLLEQKQQKAEQKKILTPQETETAIAFLQSKNLLQATNELIGSSGIIGEELNRLIMYLIFTSRKTARPLHIISFGSSGMGKSHLQEKVGELIPDEEKIEITALTENAFYYFWDADGVPNDETFSYDKDGQLADTKEVGKAFEIAAYHDGDFYENENATKLGSLKDMRTIIDRKKGQEDGKKDLPNIVGQSAANWINSAMQANPNIKLTIY